MLQRDTQNNCHYVNYARMSEGLPVSTAEEQLKQIKQICLYRDQASTNLIGCFPPTLDQCTILNTGFQSIRNRTDTNVKVYNHRCDDDDNVEDVQPGQFRSFDVPVFAFKPYDAG